MRVAFSFTNHNGKEPLVVPFFRWLPLTIGRSGIVLGARAESFAVDAVAFGEVGGDDAVRRFALAHAARVVGEGDAAKLFELPSTLPL